MTIKNTDEPTKYDEILVAIRDARAAVMAIRVAKDIDRKHANVYMGSLKASLSGFIDYCLTRLGWPGTTSENPSHISIVVDGSKSREGLFLVGEFELTIDGARFRFPCVYMLDEHDHEGLILEWTNRKVEIRNGMNAVSRTCDLLYEGIMGQARSM